MKLLMITSRNIDKKGGENALIVGRHMGFFHEYGIETDVLFYHKDNELNSQLGDGIHLLPSRRCELQKQIEDLIASKQYQGVVTSGFYDVAFNQFLSHLKEVYSFVIIVDIHATIREIYEYCIPDLYHYVGTRYLYLKKRFAFSKTLKIADFAFVVTDESIDETNSYCRRKKPQYIKVRCGCNERLDVLEYEQGRKALRDELNISDDTTAFVYSGSKSGWQKFEETVDLFEKIAQNNEDCAFAFYMDLSQEDKEMLYRRLGKDRVVVRWVKPEQMLRELAGYDIGMLLRDKLWTNKVAFPNKFSDYIHSGLALVMTDAICEPYRLANLYNIRILKNADLLKDGFCKDFIKERNLERVAYLDRCKTLIEKELLYGTQVREQGKKLYDVLQQMKEGSS